MDVIALLVLSAIQNGAIVQMLVRPNVAYPLYKMVVIVSLQQSLSVFQGTVLIMRVLQQEMWQQDHNVQAMTNVHPTTAI